MRIAKKLSVMFICLLIFGCNGTDEHNVQIVNMTNKTYNQNVSKRAADQVMSIEEVNRVNAINTDDTILLSFDVDHFKRFRIKKIEQQIQSDLKKMFPEKKIEVSYDRKIMLEIKRLQEKMAKENVKKDKLKKEIKKITDLMREKT